MRSRFEKLRAFARAPIFSPAGFLVRAFFLTAVFLVAQACGLRDYMSFLSGTPPASRFGTNGVMILGSTYLVLYFGFVLLVPALVLGAGVFGLLLRRVGRKSG